MQLKGLGKITLKIKAANPVSIPGSPYGVVSYTNTHGPFACLAALNGTYLAPRCIFPSVNPANILFATKGLLTTTDSFFQTPNGTVTYDGFSANGISLQYLAPTNMVYEFLVENLTSPISSLGPPSVVINPGQGIGEYAPEQMVGWGAFEGYLPFGIAVNAFNDIFYAVNRQGFNVIQNTIKPNIPSTSTFAFNGTNFLAQNGSSYTNSIYYSGNLYGVVETLTFDDATLNATLPVSIKAQGAFFSLELQGATGDHRFILVNQALTEYIEILADLSDVSPSLVDGVGSNFFPSLDGTIYYSDNVQGIVESGGNYTWTPLYANAELPFPAPYNMSLVRRAALDYACCPTGDGHR